MENLLKVLAVGAGACASFLFGGWSAALTTLLFFVGADIVTGLWASGSEKGLSSAKGKIGLKGKATIFIFVAMAHLFDQFVIGSGHVTRDGAITFYVVNEALSIIENAGRMGVPIPEIIRERIEMLKGKGNVK